MQDMQTLPFLMNQIVIHVKNEAVLSINQPVYQTGRASQLKFSHWSVRSCLLRLLQMPYYVYG